MSDSFKRYALTACLFFLLGAGVFSLGYIRGGGVKEENAAENNAAANGLVLRDGLSLSGGLPSIGGAALEKEEDLPELPITPASDVIGVANSPGVNQSVSDVIKAAENSVVSISTSATVRYWYRDITTEGAGSGIIFSEDAANVYIVTNYHVIDGASSCAVSIDDTKHAAAHFVGGDSIADIAVIRVSKADLKLAGITEYTVAEFGDSDKIEVGDFAIAIGNSAGEGKSATFGIISAKDKKINIDSRELTVIQTDAAINPGNSGGALVDSQSKVIGVNTAKISKSGIEGIGYSIPINHVREITADIIHNAGEVQPGYLGINGVTITDEIMRYYGFPSYGVYVRTVFTDTGAYESGLRQGDIIAEFDGAAVQTFDELNALIAKTTAGQTVKLTVYRNGSNAASVMTVTMTAVSGGINF